jgi:hypothetical protein
MRKEYQFVRRRKASCEWLAVSKGRHYFSTMIGTFETDQMSRMEKLAPPRWHKKVLKIRLAK